MSLPTIGDLSQSYTARLSIARLGRELTTLGQEVTTGVTADVAGKMKGDTAPLAAVARGLGAVSAYETAVKETTILTRATQLSLERAQGRVGDFAERAIQVSTGALKVPFDAMVTQARQSFEGLIGDLNTVAGGVSLFAGARTDGAATRDATAILADLSALTEAAATVAEVDAVIEDYFSEGGAFAGADYLGGDTMRAPVKVGPNDAVDFAPRADAAEIRDALKVLARVAVLEGDTLAGDQSARMDLVRGGIGGAVAAQDGLIALQARGGVVEERLEAAGARAAAERSGLEQARLDMISIDPFEAATRLEQSQVQLESLYAITARLSRLNLTDYMR